MSLYQVVFSPTGTTAICAAAVAEAWEGEWQVLDLTDPAGAWREAAFSAEDWVVAAMPVYAGRIPAVAAERLAELQGNGARAVAVCAYGIRAFDDAMAELQDLLTAAGFHCVAGVGALTEHSIVRTIGTGRPNAEDRAELTAFGAKIRTLPAEHQPAIPGNRPYRDGGSGPKPVVGDACIRCGLCVERCPVGAIPAECPDTTDAAVCIGCQRCIAVCPQSARSLPAEVLAGITAHLTPLCAGERKNELFC